MLTQEEVTRLLAKPTISVAEAGQILGLSLNPAYRAAKNGEIPTIRLGGSIKVPTAPIRKMLGIEVA